MSASKHTNHWRALLGALAVSGLAIGLSLRLEGAAHVPGGLSGQTDPKIAVSADDVKRAVRATSAQRRASTGEPVTYGNMSDLMSGNVPTFPTIRVDYRDDDATRMRDAGLLEGPLPLNTREGGGVALVNCSFDVDCDDGNRCTADTCDFPPGGQVGDGICENVPGNGSIGNAQCPGNFGLNCGGCDDGVFCNGVETCSGGVCVAGTPPCTGLQECSETIEAHHCSNNPAQPCNTAAECGDGNTCDVDHCQDLACASAADCHNPAVVGAPFAAVTDLRCNGTETCVVGVCVAGTNPCGSGALCGERQCSSGAGVDICITDADCLTLGTCSLLGPVCLPGRCCSVGTEPGCTKRLKRGTCGGTVIGTSGGAACTVAADCLERACVGGTNAGKSCTGAGDCPGGSCPAASNSCPAAGTSGTTASCDGQGGIWYGGDDGSYPAAGGTVCPTDNGAGVAVKCPKYGAGIAPSGVYDELLGPISDSPVVNATFGVALQKLGDDYALSNPGVCVAGTRAGLGCGINGDCPGSTCNLAGPSFMALDYLRFAGGSPSTDRISFEFYDESGNFIEDLFFSGTAAFGIYPVLFDPPITIPAKGFVVQRVAPGFSPNARHVWASTDAVDVGTNNANRMWVNNAVVNSNFGTTGILAFELEGNKIAGNFGACCYTNPDICSNAQLPWVCRGTNGQYLGNATTCAQCAGGINTGQYCRSCSNNLATVCNTDADCVSPGTCIPDNGDCPGSTCDAEPACNEGGCCDPLTGACTTETEANCVGGGRNYLGNGSDCDADNGYDDGLQHCCPQPVSSYSGGDNCEDVILHIITAPPIGETKVVTITGNNQGATNTFANPDSCFDPSDDPNNDPGWWEGFTLVDDCTIIYVDHCCSDPLVRPAYRVLYDACPCQSAVFTVANPYEFPEPPDSRGAPFCGEDDNAWGSWALLGPGPYYYPIYSALPGHHGDYQLHIVARACPRAACCTQDQCVDDVTQFDCDALGGFFLAPPNKSPAVGTCSGTNGQPGSTCFNGSCCTGPGECIDVQLAQPVTKANCDAVQGNFVGNVKCQGGTCSATTVESCSVNTDCPGVETCVGDAEALAQASPCPICEIEGPTNCQAFEDVVNFGLSDRHVGESGFLVADDVTPDGDTLNQVCVWGFYLDTDPDAPQPDCGPVVNTDHFRVRVFNNDPATGRSPGTLHGSSLATSAKGIVFGTTFATRVLAEVYGFQMVLDTPITGMTPGAIYWVEISNDVSDSLSSCLWFWMEKDPKSESLSFSGNEDGYLPTFESPFDLAFCTNFSFQPSTIGAQVAPCCTCNGLCTTKTFVDCAAVNGVWDITETSCAAVNCPIGAPANDTCANSVPISAGSIVVNNQCATTDGHGPIPSDTVTTQLDYDLWYEFIAGSSCDLVVSECRSGRRFDSMIAVYVNCPPGSAPGCDKTVCPPCPTSAALSAAHLAGAGCDDNCTNVFLSDGNWVASEQILRNAALGECFLLRVGSFPGARGTANLDVVCPTVGVTPGPVAPQSNASCTGAGVPNACCSGSGAGTCDKTRFISFTPPSGSTGETALRVKLTTLHLVNPPYTGGPSIQFTAFEGQSLYVGAPATYVESGANPTPYTTSNLQCTPHYQDWNTVGLLHVTGSAITPSSTYHVEHLAADCLNVEGSAVCVSGGANVSAQAEIKTTRWADVETPYAPGAAGQPSFSDVTALVAKFRSVPGSPIKARALILGNDAFGNFTTSTLSSDLNFGHIAACVDAFRGTPYPFEMGECPVGRCKNNPTDACVVSGDCPGATGPCTFACTTTSNCQTGGPCALYCP